MSGKHPIDETFKRGLDQKGLSYSDADWAAMSEMIANKSSQAIFKPLWPWMLGAVCSFVLSIALLPPISATEGTTEVRSADTKENSVQIDNQELKPEAMTEGSNPTQAESSISAFRSAIAQNYQHLLHDNYLAKTMPTTKDNSVESDEALYQNILDKIIKAEENKEKEKEQNATVAANREVFVERGDELLSKELPPLSSFKSAQSKIEKFQPQLIYGPMVYLNLFAEYTVYQKFVSNEIKDFKQSQEKALYSTNYGLDVRFELSNLSLYTGASYLRLVEQTDYIEQNVSYSYDTSLVLVNRNYTQRPDGSQVALIQEKVDSTASYSDTVTCPNCAVRFNYINIPLAVGYEFKNKIFTHFVRAGLNFSFLSSSSGNYSIRTLSGSESVSMETRPLSNDGAKNSMINWQLQLGTRYHLNNTFALTLSANHSRTFGSQMIAYDQKLHFYGLRFGLDIKIN